MKSFYDVLGVPVSATHEQIVAAYRLRSKILHPDRLNPAKQRAEWELANEMLKELNQAYATLRDPVTRAAYDRSMNIPNATARNQASRQQHKTTPPTPSRTSILPNLSSGHVAFQLLPRSLRQRLIDRRRGKIQQQFVTRVSRVGAPTYIVAAACCSYLWTLVGNSSKLRWDDETQQSTVIFAVIAAAILPLAVFRIIRFFSSPLKRMIFVTPLYFIETSHDQLWYWPIWQVRGISAVNRYYNSIYYGTDVTVVFPDAKRRYRIRPQATYTKLVESFRIFSEKVLVADSQQDRKYFSEEDDFRGVTANATSIRAFKILRWPLIAGTLTAFVAFGAVILAFAINQNAPKPLPIPLGTNYSIPSALPSPAGQTASTFNPDTAIAVEPSVTEPYQRSQDPPNGFVFKNSLGTGNGTIKIQNGTPYHAVVKLVDIRNGRSVFTVFVGASNEFTIQNVPDGTYRLAFASGRRWNWLADGFEESKGSSAFRDIMRFETTYRRQDDGITTYFHRFEVTFQPVVNGNAQTDSVSADTFAKF